MTGMVRGMVSRIAPVAVVVTAIMIIWYGFTVHLNAPWQIERYEKAGTEWQMRDLVRDTMAQDRPILPAPRYELYLNFFNAGR